MDSEFGTSDVHPVGSPGDGSQRRERASIAAQACETCRTRKSKCDERRPKCSLCHRLNVDCKYREPQPTKKDKTMVTILDTLSRVESKIDVIGRQVISEPSTVETPQSQSSALMIGPSSGMSLSSPYSMSAAIQPTAIYAFNSDRTTQAHLDDLVEYNILTAPQKILLWPAISKHMSDKRIASLNSLRNLVQSGTPWILRHDFLKHPKVLPALAPLASVPMPRGVAFPTLDVASMMSYTEAYFASFNRLFPLLEQSHFVEVSLAQVIRDGFGEDDLGSVLVLLVLALGIVAEQGANGVPLRAKSGIRGGTSTEPPGLTLFNEARRRMGFVMTDCSLENVECLLLTSLYYESCARHLDFWRCTVAAAASCQVVLRCEQMDWSSPRGIAMKRVYWTCNMIECWFHLDLDLPQTGIVTLQDEVPYPGDGDATATADMHYNLLHLSALEFLRKVIARIHTQILKVTRQSNELSDETGNPPVRIANEFGNQLDNWRRTLPPELQWHDADRFAYPNPNGNRGVPGTQQRLFALKQGNTERWRGGILDILTAQLRSRYYYAEFMVYRSFVFKALHHGNLMTHEDRDLAARCLRAALLWPIAMWPCKNRKRLVPVLFAWTQNFLGVLLVLRMLTVNECLKEITERYLDKQEIEETVFLLLDWLRDVKQIDGIAEWSWTIIESLYDDVAGKY